MSVIVLLGLAFAYDASDSTWTWHDEPLAYPIALNVQSFPPTVGDTASIESAFVLGMSEWNGVADLEVAYGGTTSRVADWDGWLTGVYDPGPAPGNVVATAASIGFAGGVKTDCDITFWGSNISGPVSWTLQEGGSGADLAEVATHEVGHCLGLDHSDVAGAVMWPFVGQGRGLHADDIAGIQHIYDTCSDQDGDGWTTCDNDCDDTNAAIFPGAVEVCDGADNNCDGVVDSLGLTEHGFGLGTQTVQATQNAYGSVYEVTRRTALHRFSQHVDLVEESRVTWQVLLVHPSGQTEPLVSLTDRVPAGPGWLQSPVFDLELEAGTTVYIGVGSEMAAVYYNNTPLAPAVGGLAPQGTAFQGWVAPPQATVNVASGWQAHQRLVLANVIDADGDGITGMCGDCDDDAAGTSPGSAEVCDGIDNDCDGSVDEDTPADSDLDGLIDCLDPCPDDPGDPDGDGVCTSLDRCPDDFDPAQLDTDADGTGDVCDDTPTGDPPPTDPDELVDPDGEGEESGSGGLFSCGSSVLLWLPFVAFGLRRWPRLP